MGQPDVDLPEGALLNAYVKVYSYLDSDGEMKFSVCHCGDASLSMFVGLLECGKLQLIEHAKENW